MKIKVTPLHDLKAVSEAAKKNVEQIKAMTQ
jgi:hypothetical protein